MPDLAHQVGRDLQVGPSGDLLLVSGADETNQRILHRLLTSRGSYIWQLNYGAGLAKMVGSIAAPQQIAAIIRSQMQLEAAVAASPEPAVQVTASAMGDVTASITYTESGSGSGQSLSITIGG